eukprot:CAMPEP_0182447192 /NCGR_PEP_ID=MMETSP1172-20130603/12667_1 /TAXON_ID=708627 /ORGANISM="Timspurckia oligopyrenoides, Strain CCMP3278" /LENGTH=277 /DNA_ID=CAMNT_0024643543 /DNA_START=358 /DNA_END=1191 /DNA_ORIENTATION=-
MSTFIADKSILQASRDHARSHFESTGKLLLMENGYTPSLLVPDYKLHLCTLPKVGCTELRGLVYRIEHTPPGELSTYMPSDDERIRYGNAHGQGHFLRTLHNKERLDILADPSWLHIAFVRNPYTRLLSGYLQKMVHPKDSVWHQIPGWQIGMSFDALVSILEEMKAKNGGTLLVNEHFFPQYLQCGFNVFNYDLIAHQESFEDHVRCMAKNRGFEAALKFGWGPNGSYDMFNMPRPHPTGSSNKISDYYTPQLQKRVYELYKEDFILFGYSDQLPQ